MSDAWKQLDLEGAGLQSLNASLTRHMRKARTAYLLCLLFPLGLHRFYLKEPIGGALYVALGLATLTLGLLGNVLALVPMGAALALLVFDLVWIDRRVTRYNKSLRMAQFLKPGTRPPQNYKGRYVQEDDLGDYLAEKARERGGHQPVDLQALEREADTRHIPSFAEQEALLKAMIRQKQRDKHQNKD